MGLFSFKKKKDVLPPSQPAIPIAPKPAEQKEEIDFDKMMAEIPEAPPELKSTDASFFQEQGASPFPPQPSQTKPGEKQSFVNTPLGQVSQPTWQLSPLQESEDSTPLTIGGFELPDFDDAEMRRHEQERLEEAKAMEAKAAEAKLAKAKAEEAKAAEKAAEKKPEQPKPVTWTEEPKPAFYQGPAKPVVEIKDRFIDINTYLTTKEDFETTRKVAATTEDMIEQHAIMSKAKNDKYQALVENLNTIQDKLIFIDTKLFESND
jgi:hypothetical protein